MNTLISSREDPARIAALLRRLSPLYAPTPLLDLPDLARSLGVARLHIKNEGARALGSFKSLGGTYAGLKALARAACTEIDALLDPERRPSPLPALITASAGNHGLAVAAAAKFAGTRARIYLYPGVPEARVKRMESLGAEIVWGEGTYDDAVDRATAAARAGEGLLVGDTSSDLHDSAVADIMAGYGVQAMEIRDRMAKPGILPPTHLFVQAGVGGLAAALAASLKPWMAPPAMIVVVEPEAAPCVAAALPSGRPVRIAGDLATSAGMLSCGEASAPALAVLREVRARCLGVSESALAQAAGRLEEAGLITTPSGATGFAGLATALALSEYTARFALDATSRVLLIVSEGGLDREARL